MIHAEEICGCNELMGRCDARQGPRRRSHRPGRDTPHAKVLQRHIDICATGGRLQISASEGHLCSARAAPRRADPGAMELRSGIVQPAAGGPLAVRGASVAFVRSPHNICRPFRRVSFGRYHCTHRECPACSPAYRSSTLISRPTFRVGSQFIRGAAKQARTRGLFTLIVACCHRHDTSTRTDLYAKLPKHKHIKRSKRIDAALQMRFRAYSSCAHSASGDSVKIRLNLPRNTYQGIIPTENESGNCSLNFRSKLSR